MEIDIPDEEVLLSDFDAWSLIVKRYPNSFLETELDAYLKSLGVEKLIVCGMMTHMCVDTTVRAAMDYGYEVVVAADACATMNLEYNGERLFSFFFRKLPEKLDNTT